MICWFFLIISFLFANDREDEIYNKIITDKFFRGIVADNIIENKDYASVVNGEFYTYSQLRTAVMEWIEKNPREASKRFSDIVSKKGSYSINYLVYEYKINPRLQTLIDKMSVAAKSTVKEETAREYSSMLFDGVVENVFNQPLKMSDNNNHSNSPDISYSYLEVNLNNMNREIERINSAYNYLKDFDVKDLEDIIESCDRKYIEFLGYVSSIKGNKKISGTGWERIKNIFNEMKYLLVLRSLVIKYRMVEGISYDKNLKEYLLKQIKPEITSLYALRKENIYKDFLRIYNVLNEIEKKAVFMERIKEISEVLLEDRYSCIFDYIAKNLLLKSNAYEMIKNKRKELGNFFLLLYKKIENNENYNEDDVIKKMEEAYKAIRIYNEISLNHRKIQYLFLDNIIFWDLYYYNKKIYFDIKRDVFK